MSPQTSLSRPRRGESAPSSNSARHAVSSRASRQRPVRADVSATAHAPGQREQPGGNAGHGCAGSTSRVTTAPAPTSAPRADPHAARAPPRPSRSIAPRSTTVGSSSQSSSRLQLARRRSSRAGRLSLTNITPCPTKTSSSIVTPSQMNVWLWILQLRADHRAALDLDERPDPRVVADRAAVEVRERVDDDVLAELDVVEQRGTARRWRARQPRSNQRGSLATTTCSTCASRHAGEDRQREALARESPRRRGTTPCRVAEARVRLGEVRRLRVVAARCRCRARRDAPRAPSGSAVRTTKRCQTGLAPGGTGGRARSPTPASAVE